MVRDMCPGCGKHQLQAPYSSWECPECGWSFSRPYPCPVCEKYVFEKFENYDICPVCGWENEGILDPDYAGGANYSISINEARAQFRATGNRINKHPKN